jgi:hypothetical protein
MTRHVFDTAQTCHVWAQGGNANGRSGHGSVYFDGRTLYSYGSHFILGILMNDGTALLNADSYSVSTSRHQSYARRAVSHRTSYTVPGLTDLARALHPTRDKKRIAQYVADNAEELAADAGNYLLGLVGLSDKGLRFPKLVARAVKERETKAADASAMTLRSMKDYGAKVAKLSSEEFGAAVARLRDSELKGNATKLHNAHRALKSYGYDAMAKTVYTRLVLLRDHIEAAELARQREKVARWLAGDNVGLLYGIPVMLRVRNVERDETRGICGGSLQTSQGAEVPLVHAVRAFRFLKLCREHSRPWDRNGRSVRVGHFAIDHVDADGSFRAGCHNIGWPEVERVARDLGVFETQAADTSEATQ